MSARWCPSRFPCPCCTPAFFLYCILPPGHEPPHEAKYSFDKQEVTWNDGDEGAVAS